MTERALFSQQPWPFLSILSTLKKWPMLLLSLSMCLELEPDLPRGYGESLRLKQTAYL